MRRTINDDGEIARGKEYTAYIDQFKVNVQSGLSNIFQGMMQSNAFGKSSHIVQDFL